MLESKRNLTVDNNRDAIKSNQEYPISHQKKSILRLVGFEWT
jgi:hypothetical protein